MTNNTPHPDGHWRRFGRGMLLALLIVVVWSAICWNLRDYSGPFWMELNQMIELFPLYVLVMLAQIVVALLLARWKTWWWSAGIVCGTVLGMAGPIVLALIAASGMPAMRY